MRAPLATDAVKPCHPLLLIGLHRRGLDVYTARLKNVDRNGLGRFMGELRCLISQAG